MGRRPNPSAAVAKPIGGRRAPLPVETSHPKAGRERKSATPDVSISENNHSGREHILKFADSLDGVFSLDQIKLMEDFFLFCKSKRESNREKLIKQDESHSLSDMKNKLVDSFGHCLHEEAINEICEIAHANKRNMCNSCKPTSDALLISTLQISCEVLLKKRSEPCANVILPRTGNGHQTAACDDEASCSKTVLVSQSNDDTQTQSAHGGSTPTVIVPSSNDSSSRPIDSVVSPKVSMPEQSKAFQVQTSKEKDVVTTSKVSLQQEADVTNGFDDLKTSKEKDVVNASKVSLQQEADVTNGFDELKQCNGKESFESDIRICNPGFPVVDTPAIKQVSRNPSSAAKSKTAPVHPMNRRFHFSRLDKCRDAPRTNLFAPEGLFDLHISDSESAPTSGPVKKVSPTVEVVGEVNISEKCSMLSKLTDHMYNSKHLNNAKSSLVTRTNQKPHVVSNGQLSTRKAHVLASSNHMINTQKENHIGANLLCTPTPHVVCFPITLVSVRYYNILCGLAHSQWKCDVAVQFHKTSVNFQSLGDSIEPNGHCDNFFIAGHCRNFFELTHPRNSKKHYLYPKVGYSMLLYNNDYHINVVRLSFIGANSALKLHLAEKLCFPIFHERHWFVFIVDLKNKYFAFLDSVYDHGHTFQTFVRDKLIQTFKVAWFLYAEGRLDLSDYTILYPPVPRQKNADDCGIFAVKFMELWDEHIDLRQMFSHADIPNLRVILGNNLYFSEKNKADKSLVNNMYKEGIDPWLFP